MRRHVIVFGGLSRFTPISLILTEYISNQKWAFTKRKKHRFLELIIIYDLQLSIRNLNDWYKMAFFIETIDKKNSKFSKILCCSDEILNQESSDPNQSFLTRFVRTGICADPLKGPSLLQNCSSVFKKFKKSKFTLLKWCIFSGWGWFRLPPSWSPGEHDADMKQRFQTFFFLSRWEIWL